jgi:hypothetical protein
MAGIGLRLTNGARDLANQVEAANARWLARMRGARQTAARNVQSVILNDGRADIKAGGNFGNRWTDAWTAQLDKPTAELGEQMVISTFFDGSKFLAGRRTGPNYAHVFEFGATIKAKNASGFLWIPLSFANVPIDAWPRDSANGYFMVRRSGKAPLLLSLADKQPTFFGLPQVTLRPRFHLRDIGTKAAAQFKDFYNKAF